MITYVFCHGWAFNADYWQPLLPFFKEDKTIIWDNGYFGPQNYPLPSDFENCIAIGHSLGFSKLIQSNLPFKAIIGLHGFTNFLGNTPSLRRVREREWNKLYQDFQSNPEQCLKSFHQVCGAAPNTILFNKDYLEEDLLELHKDLTPQLPPIPCLILASKDDQVVTPRLLADNFSRQPLTTLELYDSGKHSLGHTHSQLIATKIKEFVGENV